MLRDYVCDEVTNIALCLFDGGDCCLEGKDRSLCRNCSCILSVDNDDLQKEFDDWDIKPLDKPEDFFGTVGTWTVVVREVISGPVCIVLCLNHDQKDQINAWHYGTEEQICTCGWIGSTNCPEDMVLANQTMLDDGSLGMSKTFGAFWAFVQLGKTVPCGIYFVFLRTYLVSID